MIKRLFLVLLLMAPLAVSAQDYYNDYYATKGYQAKKPKTSIDWGLTAGAGWYAYNSSVELYEVKGGLGWQAGLQAAFMWNSVGVRFEANYARHGVDLIPHGHYPEVKMSYNKVEVPILVAFNPSIFRIHLGPVFRVLNNCQHTTVDGLLVDFGMLRPTVGFTVGAGLKLGRHWILDLRYNGDFSPAKGVFYDGGPEVSIRENSLQLSVGFVL